MAGDTQFLPGGHIRILYGGTRTKIKLSRPWQPPLADIVRPRECPFCTKPQEEFALPDDMPSGWKLLPNPFTPHRDHRLLIPSGCKSAEWLEHWGGVKNFEEAFRIVSAVLCQDAAATESGVIPETTLLVMVGYLAGQNLGHPHLHLFSSDVDWPQSYISLHDYAAHNPGAVVGQNEVWVVAAGGARSGECLIIPRREQSFAAVASSLAKVVSQLIELGNEKFRSVQGMSPHWGLVVRIASGGTFRYAGYSPTLHLWGPLQYMAVPLEGDPIVLPWPHETTAAYLRGESV